MEMTSNLVPSPSVSSSGAFRSTPLPPQHVAVLSAYMPHVTFRSAAVIPADGDDVELGSVPFGIIIRSISLDPATSPTRGRAVRIHAARHIPARADRGERWAPFGGRSLREKVPNTPLDFIVTKHGPRLTDRVDAQEHSRGL